MERYVSTRKTIILVLILHVHGNKILCCSQYPKEWDPMSETDSVKIVPAKITRTSDSECEVSINHAYWHHWNPVSKEYGIVTSIVRSRMQLNFWLQSFLLSRITMLQCAKEYKPEFHPSPPPRVCRLNLCIIVIPVATPSRWLECRYPVELPSWCSKKKK